MSDEVVAVDRRPSTVVWAVVSTLALVASAASMYALVLATSLGAGATLGGFGEGPRPATADWFEPAVLVFVVAWLATFATGVVLARRRLAWLALPFVALAVMAVVAMLLARWWPA
jgi:hypothetical protein